MKNSGTGLGGIWFIGRRFTIRFANPVWWKILPGLLFRPYYPGQAVG